MRLRWSVRIACALVVATLSGIAYAEDQPGDGPPSETPLLAETMASGAENAVTFRIDSHPELDFYQPCSGGDNLIAFPINVQGVDLATVEKAELVMQVWDVDYDCGSACSGYCERDTVYINGNPLTKPVSYLTGADGQWSSVSFDVSPAWLVEGNNDIDVFIDTLGHGCWCVTVAWAELRLELGATPAIEEIEISTDYFGEGRTKQPTTTHDVTFTAIVKMPEGYAELAVCWWGDIPGGSGHGNPLTVKPKAGTHGKDKEIIATVMYVEPDGELACTLPKKAKFDLFFDKRGDDKGDGKANWWYYWGQGDDGASTSFNRQDFEYGGGGWSGESGLFGTRHRLTGTITLYDKATTAAEEWTYDQSIQGTARQLDNPLLRIHGADVKGVDCLEWTIAHERAHGEIDALWGIRHEDGGWEGLPDSDGDRIPDLEENRERNKGLNPDSADSAPDYPTPCSYFRLLGWPVWKLTEHDEEIWCDLRGQEAAFGTEGIPGRGSADWAKDWANQGKNTSPSFSFRPGPDTGTDATLGDLYTDRVEDRDGDGLFETLVISVPVTVASPGTYRVIGTLADSAGNVITSEESAYLLLGAQSLELPFPGEDLREHRVDGPFTLAGLALTGAMGLDAAEDAHTTAAYAWTGFQGRGSEILPGITESVVDTSADGLADELRIVVPVSVKAAGPVQLEAYLCTADDRTIDFAVASDDLLPGQRSLVLSFDGHKIRQARSEGPYVVASMSLYEGEERVDFLYQPHETSAYSYRDFQGGPAELCCSAVFSHSGVDLNSNGLYDVLRVTLPTFISVPGQYSLFGRLFDADGNLLCEALAELQLAAGLADLVLDFPGEEIRVSGNDGPYLLRYAFLLDLETGAADSLPTPYEIPGYAAVQFEAPAVALTGQFGDVSVDTNGDGTYEYLEVEVGVFTASAGTYALNARLMDSNGLEIDWASRSAYVSGGQPQVMTLAFSGSTIYSHGVNGPYVVRDVLLYKVSNPGLYDYLYDDYFTESAWRVELNRPPVADAGPDRAVDALDPRGIGVRLDGSASTDPDSTPGTNDDIVHFEWLEGDSLLARGMKTFAAMPIGPHHVTLRVIDSQEEQAEDDVEITVVRQVILAEIDVKPGSYPNAINLGAQGVVPVAILSSEQFDATEVDPRTLELAGAGVAVRGKGDVYLAHQEDVDGDGTMDLVVQVQTENLDPGQFDKGQVCITASTYAGLDVEGCDDITIVPSE